MNIIFSASLFEGSDATLLSNLARLSPNVGGTTFRLAVVLPSCLLGSRGQGSTFGEPHSYAACSEMLRGLSECWQYAS